MVNNIKTCAHAQAGVLHCNRCPAADQLVTARSETAIACRMQLAGVCCANLTRLTWAG